MKAKAVKIFVIGFVLIAGIAFSDTILAKTRGFTVRLYPKNDEPVILEDFTHIMAVSISLESGEEGQLN